MGKFSQLKADAFEQMQFNAGTILRKFDPEKGTVAEEDIVGATTGGVKFEAKATFKDLGDGVDNCPKNTKELKRIESIEAKLTGTYVSASKKGIAEMIGAADVEGTGTKVVPRAELEDEDFHELWFVGDYGADNGFVAIKLVNSLSTGGLSVQTEDKGKGQFAFEFTAHSSLATPDVVPYEVYVKAGE